MARRSFHDDPEPVGAEALEGERPDLDGDDVVGDDGSTVGGPFFSAPAQRFPAGHWGNRLRRDPTKKTLPWPPNNVGPDEIRWGDQKTLNIDGSAGTGPFIADEPQLLQVRRPARVWSIDLAFALPGINALPTLSSFYTVTTTFTLILGCGSSRIFRYEQLFSADLVAFAPDPAFPTNLNTPIVSRVITDLPANDIMVSAHVEFQRITLASPPTLQVLVSAAVAPVIR